MLLLLESAFLICRMWTTISFSDKSKRSGHHNQICFCCFIMNFLHLEFYQKIWILLLMVEFNCMAWGM